MKGGPAIRGGRSGFLRLDLNENTVGCSPRVLRALAGLGAAEAATYPDQRLAIAAIARRHKVARSHVVLSAGTDEGLRLVVDALARPGDRILGLEPSFVMYRFHAERSGAGFRAVDYGPGMELPLEKVKRELARRPRIFFLANPNNPTGTLVKRPALREILEAAPDETVVVVDEAYHEFSGVTVLPWIRRRANLIVSRTFSKAAGLAGLRVGFLCAAEPLAGRLRAAQSPFPVSSAALAAAEAACRDTDHVARYVQEVLAARDLLESALERMGIPFYPSAGNFVMADLGRRVRPVLTRLSRRGILLGDRTGDLGREGFVRITVGTRSQMRRLIRELREVWR